MDNEEYETVARELLSILGFQDQKGDWWGKDTNCGTDSEITGEAIEILKKHFGTTISAVQPDDGKTTFAVCSCGYPITQDSCPKCDAWHDLYGRR